MTRNRIASRLALTAASSAVAVTALLGPTSSAWAVEPGSSTAGCASACLAPAYPPSPGPEGEPSFTVPTAPTSATPTSASPTSTPGSGTKSNADPAGGTSQGGSGSSTTPAASPTIPAPAFIETASAGATAPKSNVLGTSVSFTGAQSVLLGTVAAALIAAGAVLVTLSRKRNAAL